MAFIGRANLDGTGVDQYFIPLGDADPCGLAVDGAHLYWTNIFPSPSGIGRANRDGGGVDQNFIRADDVSCGVAVDALEPPPASPPAHASGVIQKTAKKCKKKHPDGRKKHKKCVNKAKKRGKGEGR